MSQPSPFEIKLMEKIVRAKVALEQIPLQDHSLTCPVEADPEGMAPCNCGAAEYNEKLAAVATALKID